MPLIPSGDKLLDFVYVNVIVYDEGPELLSPSIYTKLQYVLLKHKISRIQARLRRLLRSKKKCDCESLKNEIFKSSNSWDLLLFYTILKLVLLGLSNSNPSADDIISVFYTRIFEMDKYTADQLSMDLKYSEIQLNFDLIRATYIK